MVKVEVNLTKGAVLFFALMFVIVALTLVYAYGSGDPAVHGHDMGEIAFTCQTVHKECSGVKECNVECPAGYVATGGGFQNTNGDTSIDHSVPLNNKDPTKEGWHMYDYYGATEGDKKIDAYAVCCNIG